MTKLAETRETTLTNVIEKVQAVFDRDPQCRSALVAFAQYWNDQASDEVHAMLVISARDTPVWPHACAAYDDDAVALPGEVCCDCGEGIPYLHSPPVEAWEPFCHEYGDQNVETGDNYVPYAILRRGDDLIEVELVGTLLRPHAELADDHRRAPVWGERARALFAQVCAHPRDDGPRLVLSDHLLESRPTALDPRGEYIALALARELPADAQLRRDRLLDANRAEWIAPLASVIPAGCAHFERGFLARVDVYASSTGVAGAVRGAATWGTVESLRYLPLSCDVLDPVMTALRTVGAVDPFGVDQLAGARRPWAIERMQVSINDADSCRQLGATPLLPQLRELTVDARLDLDLLAGAVWWRQLERLTVVGRVRATWVDERAVDPPREPAWYAALRSRLGVPWLAVAACGLTYEPAGWELAIGPDRTIIRMAGWHPSATLPSLAKLVAGLPPGPLELQSTRWRTCTDFDIDFIAQCTGRTLQLTQP